MRFVLRYSPTILLVAIAVIGEMHSYFPNPDKIENWIYSGGYAMLRGWNFKFLSDQINTILIVLLGILYADNRNIINKASVRTLLCWVVIDMAMYYHNFKTLYYGSVYVYVFLLWGINFLICKKRLTLSRK